MSGGIDLRLSPQGKWVCFAVSAFRSLYFLLTIDLYVDGNPHHLSIILTTIITTIACIIPLTFCNLKRWISLLSPPFQMRKWGPRAGGGAGLTGVVRTGI